MRKITIKGEIIDFNNYLDIERSNRYAGATAREEEINSILSYLENEKTVEEYPLYFVFKWIVTSRRKDKDNIAFAKKFILDAFQDAGIIRNDGWKEVENWKDLFEVDKNNPRVLFF